MPNASDQPNYYVILGVEESASEAEIKLAYRAAAKHHHPDAGGSLAVMNTINVAYGVLSDASKRHEYDTELQIERESKLVDEIPLAEAEMLYQNMTALERAEAFRQRAEANQIARYRWARRSAADLMGGALLWLAGSLAFGVLLHSALQGSAVVVWSLINAGILAVCGFGAISLVWPEQRLALFDFSPYHHIYPSAIWWQRTGFIILAAVILSAILSAIVLTVLG